MADKKTVEELVGFLSDGREEVRVIAVQHVAGMTGTDEGRALLKECGALGPLVRQIGGPDRVASHAVTALVNLSAESGFLEELLRLKVVSRLMEALRSPECSYRRLAMMLLSNLCQTTAGCRQLLQKDDDEGALMGLHIRRLVRLFVDPPGGEADDVAFAALVLQSVSQLKEARTLLASREREMIPDLLRELRSPNLVRRRGIAGLFKNLCFDSEFRDGVQDDAYGPVIINLARPLAGPEPIPAERREGMPAAWRDLGRAKVRECDPATRRSLCEALVLLGSHSRKIRDYFRSTRLYEVVRRTHAWLEGADVEKAMAEAHPFMHPSTTETPTEEEEEEGQVHESKPPTEAIAERVQTEADLVASFGLDVTNALPTISLDDIDDDNEVTLPPEDEATVEAINQLVNLIHRDEEE